MKTIQIVSQITAQAEARACYNSEIGSARTVRNGNVVYGALFVKSTNSEQAELYHYGTKTAHVVNNLDGKGWQVLHVYGESKSDADSVNTFMQYFNVAKRYTYRPVNGGFQEVN